jgi:hypothetical protein
MFLSKLNFCSLSPGVPGGLSYYSSQGRLYVTVKHWADATPRLRGRSLAPLVRTRGLRDDALYQWHIDFPVSPSLRFHVHAR